ncbi:hypothetical protein [Nocardia miyunensis]|uniref:hypothetical protein n=1 Tax=Nocardia miyunensis TaxID=282684 RepID=UPI00082E1A50|nr:hypothetical protein [Nocardia miyunensis]
MNTISRATALATLALAATTLSMGAANAAPVQTKTVAATPAADKPAPAASSDADRSAAIDAAVAATVGAYGNATHDSQLIATGVGAAVGCGVGAVTGGTLTVLTTAGTLTPVGVLGGCILGGAAFGGLSGFAAGLTGIPPAVATATDQYNKLHAEGYVAAPVPTAP